MEKFIFNYLDKKYVIKCSSVGNYGVYLKPHNIEEFSLPYNGSILRNEVTTVFGVENDTSKIIIEKWAIFHGADSLDFYWSYNSINFDISLLDEMVLPLARNVRARTIGLDLVSVTPMNTPIGKLMFLDTNYSGGINTNNVEISNDLCDAYVESLNKTRRKQKIKDKWNSSGLLDGLIP